LAELNADKGGEKEEDPVLALAHIDCTDDMLNKVAAKDPNN
jgi:hypothetical protein